MEKRKKSIRMTRKQLRALALDAAQTSGVRTMGGAVTYLEQVITFAYLNGERSGMDYARAIYSR